LKLESQFVVTEDTLPRPPLRRITLKDTYYMHLGWNVHYERPLSKGQVVFVY